MPLLTGGRIPPLPTIASNESNGNACTLESVQHRIAAQRVLVSNALEGLQLFRAVMQRSHEDWVFFIVDAEYWWM